eukprot:GHVP01053805.1.p1 GENE.GHVP01053805.1~~GHVP01053805.1.p1  ORF type:complete len:400 (+),score=54.66 GHVP01053805.1:27-1226(+)
MNFLVISLAANAGFILVCWIVLKLTMVEDWFAITSKIAQYRSWTLEKNGEEYSSRENSRKLGGILKESQLHLSIVIPCYDEEERLPKMMPDLVKYLESRNRVDPFFTCEVIFVDDGSEDNTLGVMETFAKCFRSSWLSFRIIDISENHGKGFATKAGVLAALGEYILMMDADGATRLEDLELLERAIIQLQLDEIKNSPAEQPVPVTPEVMHPIQKAQGRIMYSETRLGAPLSTSCFSNYNTKAITNTYFAFGSRAHLIETPEVTQRLWYRNVLMNIFRVLVALLIGTIAQDTQCGFKLFPRKVAMPLFMSLHTEKWAFDCEIFALARKYHIKALEVPVKWTEVEGSKLCLLTASLGMLFDLLRIRILYGLRIWKPVHAGRTRDSIEAARHEISTWENM